MVSQAAQLADTVLDYLDMRPEAVAALDALVELAEKAEEWQMAAGAEAQHADEVQAERDAAVADNQTLKVLGDKWVARAADAEARAAKLEAALREIADDSEDAACYIARAALLVSAGRDETNGGNDDLQG